MCARIVRVFADAASGTRGPDTAPALARACEVFGLALLRAQALMGSLPAQHRLERERRRRHPDAYTNCR